VAAKTAPASLVEATIQAALTPSLAGTAAVSGSVVQLTQGVLRSMFLIKLKTVVAAFITIAALGVGAGAVLQVAPAPRPEPLANPDQVRSELGAKNVGKAARPVPSSETEPPPQDLTWTAVAPEDRLRVMEQLAALSRDNYDKIKRWRGTYSYIVREYLTEQFVAQAFSGARPPAGKAEPLMQEFDRVLKFAIDLDSDSIYRDVETRRMRSLRIGTDEEVKIPNVGAWDHRWIITPDRYLDFSPKEKGTWAVLPNHPDAQNKRRAERLAVSEARNRAAGEVDPRGFFKFDPMNSFWTSFEMYQRVLRGDLGAERKKLFEERLTIEQAEGPGGRWYRDRLGFGNPGGPMFWATTLWSPQAGYNPVSKVTTLDKPDGKPQSKMEWRWKRYDRAYLPSTIEERIYAAPGGALSKEQVAKLTECTLNKPLGLHQFDEQGLGMVDGDLVLDHPKKVVYIIKGGEPVKLANFGEGSILKPAPPKPAPKAATAKKPSPKSAGRIYTTANLGTNDAGQPVASVVAVDPDTGEVTKVFERSPGRFRVAPDGRRLAFTSIEWWSNLTPAERMQESLWTQALAEDARPERVVPLEGTGGGVPIWSTDGKRMLLSLSTHDDARKQWDHETFRINADGSAKERLKLPTEFTVQDWSPDGAWVVTASTRNAKIGWQLYIMRPDGSDSRQITEGGNPFYARFSPDGQHLLYTDGPWKMTERQGIWIMDFDGKNRRRILASGKGTASACWSPDGTRIAVAIQGAEPTDHGRFEVVNLDGTHRTLLTMPGRDVADMPDWR
jgi:hypothetical protein